LQTNMVFNSYQMEVSHFTTNLVAEKGHLIQHVHSIEVAPLAAPSMMLPQ